VLFRRRREAPPRETPPQEAVDESPSARWFRKHKADPSYTWLGSSEQREDLEILNAQRAEAKANGTYKVILTYGHDAVLPEDLPAHVFATRQSVGGDGDYTESYDEIDRSRYSEREIVYVLERLTSEGRFFKIGKTSRNDVSRRAYEVRSTIVSYTNSVRERDVHRELRRSRIHRSQLPAEITDAHGPTEWFRPTPEVERFAFEGILPSGRTATMVADRAA